jgi:hypothetical protein
VRLLPFFVVHLTHSYYADGRCLDFRVEPTCHTRRLLSNHRCVLEPRPNGVQVFATVTDQGSLLIPLRQDAAFTFDLHLVNSDFARFTDLAALDAISAPLFTNADLPPGDMPQLALVSRTRAAPAISRPAAKVFAAVEIRHNDTLAPGADGPRTFHVTFQAKQARWVYYLVTDLSYSGDAIQIVDAAASPLVFSGANRRDLNQEPAPSDAVAQRLASRYPDLRRFRFVSDGLVSCQQTSRKQIYLYLDGTRVAGALPNPSTRHAITMAVDSHDTALQDDALFHIVKHITHPFPRTGG